MGWPLRKTLYGGAFPAAIFLVAWTTRDLTRRSADESVMDVVLPIFLIVLALWLAASFCWWLVSKIFWRKGKQHQ